MQTLVLVNKEPMVKLTFVPHSQPAMSVRSPEWELPWNRVLRAMSEDEDFDEIETLYGIGYRYKES